MLDINEFKLCTILLTAFDSGADGGAVADGNGNTGEVGTPDGEPTVVFGKGDEAAAQPNTDTAKEDAKSREKRFKEMIKGEFKDLYDSEFEKTFNRRFKNHKDLEENFKKADKIVGLMADRYGEKNVDKLTEAILNDAGYLEQEAYEKGYSDPKELARVKQLEREAEALRAREAYFNAQMQFENQQNEWAREAAEYKLTNPDFDLRAESENPQFIQLLKSGVGVETAYKVIHHDEIIAEATRTAMQSSAKATADSIAARGMRTKENSGTKAAVVYKSDPSKFTPKDREEIARRVRRGETIIL